jgi:L-aspartate oxidase
MTAANAVIEDGLIGEKRCEEAQWSVCVSEINEGMWSAPHAAPEIIEKTADILYDALGIVREDGAMRRALDEIKTLISEHLKDPWELPRLFLAEAMLSCALARKESRGAHYRSDFPERDKNYQKYMRAQYGAGREPLSLIYCK